MIWSDHKVNSDLRVDGGAWTDKGDLMTWDELCPVDYDQEIFRDINN